MPASGETNIGVATPAAAGSTTIAFTTTILVPAGSKIKVYPGWFGAVNLSSVAGGGLTWTVDSQVSNGSDRAAVAWADVVSDLGSGTTITATLSGSGTSRYMSGSYGTGIETGAAIGRNSGTTNVSGAWTSGTVSVATGDSSVGCCYAEAPSSATTSTASGGNTEITGHDVSIDTDSAMTDVYQVGVGTSIAAQGTWSRTDVTPAAMIVVFAAAGAGVEPSVSPDTSNFPKYILSGRSPV